MPAAAPAPAARCPSPALPAGGRDARLLAQMNQPYPSANRPTWTSADGLESCPTNRPACPKWENKLRWGFLAPKQTTAATSETVAFHRIRKQVALGIPGPEADYRGDEPQDDDGHIVFNHAPSNCNASPLPVPWMPCASMARPSARSTSPASSACRAA